MTHRTPTPLNRGDAQQQLGAEIDTPDPAELITRVAELESRTRQLLAERDARTAEANHAQHRIHELEDDLTAARESLRRVIKDHNRPATT
jgi:predicted  nucleic acid-binding Zn-ribbon protein